MWLFSFGRHFETDVGEALWSKVNSGVGAALSQDYVATCSSTLENINKKISFAALCLKQNILRKKQQQWFMNFTYSIIQSLASSILHHPTPPSRHHHYQSPRHHHRHPPPNHA